MAGSCLSLRISFSCEESLSATRALRRWKRSIKLCSHLGVSFQRENTTQASSPHPRQRQQPSTPEFFLSVTASNLLVWYRGAALFPALILHPQHRVWSVFSSDYVQAFLRLIGWEPGECIAFFSGLMLPFLVLLLWSGLLFSTSQ
jgi:hypothetical protein